VAARTIAKAPAAKRTAAIGAIADSLDRMRDEILDANARDVAAGESEGLAPAMLDRLRLDPARLRGLERAVSEIGAAPEIVGRVDHEDRRPNGLVVSRVRIPLGVIAMIYESRPNVTTDAAALCLKAGNACILRGGREAAHSNAALLKAVQLGLVSAGLPADACTEQLLPVAREASLPDGLVRDLVRLVQPAQQPQQHGLLVERAQAAQAAELLEPLAGSAQIDAFAQGGRIVSEDDAQGSAPDRWFPNRLPVAARRSRWLTPHVFVARAGRSCRQSTTRTSFQNAT